MFNRQFADRQPKRWDSRYLIRGRNVYAGGKSLNEGNAPGGSGHIGYFGDRRLTALVAVIRFCFY